MRNEQAVLSKDLLKGGEDYSASTATLPPVPEWFNNALTNIGGKYDDKPLLRVVSGLDHKEQLFYNGEFHRKYVGARDYITDVTHYEIVNPVTQARQIYTAKTAIGTVVDKEGKLLHGEGIVLPHTKQEVIEYGVPRYVLERYSAPQEFGSREEWQIQRYWRADDVDNPTGKTIDVLGEFPYEGRYVFMMYIEHAVVEEKNGQDTIVGYEFRELDQSVLDEIAEIVNQQRRDSELTAEQREENARLKLEARREAKLAKFRDELEKAIKPHEHKLFGNARVFVPSLSYKENK